VTQGRQPQGAAAEQHDEQCRGKNQKKEKEPETATDHGLVLVRRVLLIEIPDRLEPLVQAFHLGLIFRP